MATTADALAHLRARAPQARPQVAVLLGSGWGGLTAHLLDALRLPYAELPGFPQASVAGHAGELWLGRIGAIEVAVLSGRQHGYETGAVDGMAVPLRTLHALGCKVLVQTNAAGSLNADMGPGSLMLVADHINMVQRSPLVGATGADRFVGMADAYDRSLRLAARQVATRLGVKLFEGVYLWCLGPQFETPAEIRAFRALGADAVGMSTVPETILARHSGMRVLALSLITNLAAGMSGEQLSHARTLAQAQLASDKASRLLAAIVSSLSLAGDGNTAP
ncbi:MAG: purine-nucleoside phosphorylase [Rhodoferax sp.]|nr:purine-nucleoside phosphorylase [Rhodoferax sp.]